jgi:pimeloyl-ACP methyl ester carboxylesterase
MALLDMVALDRPQPEKVKTPLLVLGVGHDNMLNPREIEATAWAYHTQAEIIPDVAHNSMLDPRWQSVAERILAWLTERPVANATVHGTGFITDCPCGA